MILLRLKKDGLLSKNISVPMNIDFEEVYSVEGKYNFKIGMFNLFIRLRTSIYLAVLSHTDPSPVNAIDFIKKKLR